MDGPTYILLVRIIAVGNHLCERERCGNKPFVLPPQKKKKKNIEEKKVVGTVVWLHFA